VGAQIIQAHNLHSVTDKTHGMGDDRQISGRRFRTELNDGDGDGRAEVAMSEVMNHADGDDRTTHQRQVKLTLES
jgi:hypothetical protein